MEMVLPKSRLALGQAGAPEPLGVALVHHYRFLWVLAGMLVALALVAALGGRMFYEIEHAKIHALAQQQQSGNVPTAGRNLGEDGLPVAVLDEKELKAILFKLTLAFLVILGSFSFFILLLVRNRAKQYVDIFATQRGVVFALANLAEIRDEATGRHLERTRSYGVILCAKLRRLPKYRLLIDETFLDDLYYAAPLHDIGKVGTPDRVLLKPGPLNDDEFGVMQKHAEIGSQIIDRIIEKLEAPLPFLRMSRNIARHHHERFDGGGYPDRLAGEAIPLEARIYALCDAYDAIRAKRPYKDAVTHMEAVQRLMTSRSSQFDPDVVNAFLDCEEQFMELYESYQVYDKVYLGFAEQRGDSSPAVLWSKEFEVGVEMIDHQHQELIARINKLLVATRQGRGREETFELMRYLQDYVIEHFRAEEMFMLRNHYEDYANHKEMHDHFVADLQELAAIMEEHGIDSNLVVLFNQKVINWVVAHIFQVDKGLWRVMHPKLAHLPLPGGVEEN